MSGPDARQHPRREGAVDDQGKGGPVEAKGTRFHVVPEAIAQPNVPALATDDALEAAGYAERLAQAGVNSTTILRSDECDLSTARGRLAATAFKLGQMVAGGELDRGYAESVLTMCAYVAGIDKPVSLILERLDAGHASPRTMP